MIRGFDSIEAKDRETLTKMVERLKNPPSNRKSIKVIWSII